MNETQKLPTVLDDLTPDNISMYKRFSGKDFNELLRITGMTMPLLQSSEIEGFSAFRKNFMLNISKAKRPYKFGSLVTVLGYARNSLNVQEFSNVLKIHYGTLHRLTVGDAEVSYAHHERINHYLQAEMFMHVCPKYIAEVEARRQLRYNNRALSQSNLDLLSDDHRLGKRYQYIKYSGKEPQTLAETFGRDLYIRYLTDGQKSYEYKVNKIVSKIPLNAPFRSLAIALAHAVGVASLREFSASTGVSKSTLCYLLNGDIELSYYQYVRVKDHLTYCPFIDDLRVKYLDEVMKYEAHIFNKDYIDATTYNSDFI